MAGFYTEASYENAVIKIFTDVLGYQYIYAPELERDLKGITAILFMKIF